MNHISDYSRRFAFGLFGVSAFALIISSGPVSAAPAPVIISDTTGDASSVSLSPGQTFTISLSLTTTTNSVGTSYLLDMTTPSGSGLFSITTRDTTGSPFVSTSTNTAVTTSPGSILNPVNDVDLGGTLADVGTPLSSGTYFLATYTITLSGTITAGTYTLTIDPSTAVYTDDGFNDVPITSNTYTITVVPEPSTYALFGIGAVMASGTLLRRKLRA